MQIAPTQKQNIDFLRATLSEMDSVVGENDKDTIDAFNKRINDWAAKIAVIGQVKAGKSTFINAFLNEEELLPSDVNPWTSVITNIRINMNGDPETGAKFEFFSEKDWAEIIEGNAEIRELTEQLLPGFDTELLKKQSEEMKERAQRRLGKHFQTMLGTEHDYNFLNQDLLRRYVCAGPGSDTGLTTEALGRYAALTKVANLYLRLPEFQIPAILTDTPGVNDPFLVRDEFTCRSLDKSDVFIVVLSAHQALTEVDVALIRILAQQDTKDVLIFVNRIDELDDFQSQVPRVIQDVSKRLTDAIPGIDFSIHAGSAHLANLAIRSDEDAVAQRSEIDTPELHAFLQSTYGSVPQDQLERFKLASGLAAVKQTLSKTIDRGVGCQQLSLILEDLRAEINGAQFTAEQEQKSVRSQMAKIGSNSEDAIAALETELLTVKQAHAEVDIHIRNSKVQINTAISKARTGLEMTLNAAIVNFIEEHRGSFSDEAFLENNTERRGRAAAIDLSPLCKILEDEIGARYELSRSTLDFILKDNLEGCKHAIAAKLANTSSGVSLAELPNDAFASTLTLTKRAINVELSSDRGWAVWKKRTVDVDKSVETLRTIALAELKPAIEKILTAFTEALSERSDTGRSRVAVLSKMVETSIKEREKRLAQDRTAQGGDAQDRLTSMTLRLENQTKTLDSRLKQLNALEAKLSKASLEAAA